jgi:hypothetical protein
LSHWSKAAASAKAICSSESTEVCRFFLLGNGMTWRTMRYMDLSPEATQNAIRLVDRRPVEEKSGGKMAAATSKN